MANQRHLVISYNKLDTLGASNEPCLTGALVSLEIKACLRYVLSNFCFFHQMIARQKLREVFFISSKSSFVLEIFKFL